jgi:hypothetical protein
VARAVRLIGSRLASLTSTRACGFIRMSRPAQALGSTAAIGGGGMSTTRFAKMMVAAWFHMSGFTKTTTGSGTDTPSVRSRQRHGSAQISNSLYPTVERLGFGSLLAVLKVNGSTRAMTLVCPNGFTDLTRSRWTRYIVAARR